MDVFFIYSMSSTSPQNQYSKNPALEKTDFLGIYVGFFNRILT